MVLIDSPWRLRPDSRSTLFWEGVLGCHAVMFPRPWLSACFVWGELQPAAGESRRDELEPVCGRQERLVHGFSLFGTQGMARRALVGEVVEILAHLKMRLRGSALL